MPMRQLRSCDFCGGDAAGVYEVLPPGLSPTEAEQRRVVLCADCAATLETVVDPLLDRLGVETSTDTSAGDAGDRSVAAASSASKDPDNSGGVGDRGPPGRDPIGREPSSHESPERGSADNESPDREPADRTGEHGSEPGTSDDRRDVGDGSPSDRGRPADEEAEPGSGEPGPPTTRAAPADDDPDEETGPVQWGEADPVDGGSGASERPPGDSVRDGVPRIDPSGDTDAAGSGTEPDARGAGADTGDARGGTVDGATSGTDAADSAGADAAEPGGDAENGDPTDAADPVTSDEPEEFRTVMRLLGNREFPVERDDIVELAASAYELDEGHVHRVIDYAVDRGVIADDAGTLRRN